MLLCFFFTSLHIDSFFFLLFLSSLSKAFAFVLVTIYFICFLQVGILKRVLEEVEKVMQEFKGMLYKSLEDPHIDQTNVSHPSVSLPT